MIITQAFVGVQFFRSQFLKKWGLENYSNPNRPAVFFGLYKKQWHLIRSHKSLAIIVFAGSDVLHLKTDSSMIRFLRNRPNTYFIAISNFIENDLKDLNIPFISKAITPVEYKKPTPVPLGNCVYMYSALKKKEFYGENFLRVIKRKLPKIKFIVAYHNTYTATKLKSVYKKCFIGLRLTKHDGLSNTAVELGMFGRKVIWNGNTPNAINYKTVNDIINLIKKEQLKIGETNRLLAKSVYNYVNINKDWLDTEYYIKNYKDIPPLKKPKKKAVMKKNEIVKVKILKPVKQTRYKASVIINTIKEDKKNLQLAIDSYKNQKNVDMQIIISTIIGDPAVDLAHKNKVQVYINDKPGIYYQLNNALKIVKNEWFCYASGNDVAMPNKLWLEISKCIATKKKICYSNFYHTNETFKVIKQTTFYDYDIRKHLQGNFVNDCATIHFSILKKYAPFSLKWGNHAYWDFWLRVYAGEGNIFCFNSIPTWKYRISSKSSHVIRAKNAKARKANRQLRYKMIRHHMNILKIK